MSTTTYFCPHCNAIREIFEHFEGPHLVVRCQRCESRLDEGVAERGGFAFQRTKVLCIDDDALLATYVTHLLAEHDFQPLTAPDGPRGLATARRERPALTLLDIMMPGPDGFETCRQFRADPELRDAPIIIMTGSQDPKLTAKAFKVGATLTLHKPLDPERLIGAIKAALALKPKPSTA